MMRPPRGSYRPVSDLSRVVKILVLRCTASQDIKAKPTRSLSYRGAFHQLAPRAGARWVSIGYPNEQGGEGRIVPARASREGKLRERAGRFSLCVQTETLP